MATRGHNVLDGMEELFLSLVRKHSSPDQWGSWLKVRKGTCWCSTYRGFVVDSLLQGVAEPASRML